MLGVCVCVCVCVCVRAHLLHTCGMPLALQALEAGCSAALSIDSATHTLRLAKRVPGGPAGAGPAPAAEVWGALQARGELQATLQRVAGEGERVAAW